jgi:hypothetical protein
MSERCDNLSLGDDGILVATMDLPGRPMNVVGDELMAGIAARRWRSWPTRR